MTGVIQDQTSKLVLEMENHIIEGSLSFPMQRVGDRAKDALFVHSDLLSDQGVRFGRTPETVQRRYCYCPGTNRER